MTTKIVGIQLNPVGKIYHFDASQIDDNLAVGDYVIVETARGEHIGQIVKFIEDPGEPPQDGWKPVLRRATPADLVLKETWKAKEPEVVDFCRQWLKKENISEVKIIAAQFTFDGKRLAVMYSQESKQRINLNNLRQEVSRRFNNTNVELRQLGPRDVAKILGGLGACGLEKRCCSLFLTDFSPVSIKMAKIQGMSLTPSEITGMCGRLRCCLVYEYEQYVEAAKQLPKRKKKVITPKGEGRVVNVFPLRDSVLVQIPDQGTFEFTREEITPKAEWEALQKKAQAPCQNCGKNGQESVPDEEDDEDDEDDEA
jgi:cell fate regulator YaaT (PSP1 superfamily)